MVQVSRISQRQIVVAPRGALIAGGPAEALERQLQEVVRGGTRGIVIDLSEVDSIDETGLRALVRGHTSSRRTGSTLRLAGVRPAVRRVLEETNLHRVFESYASVDAAKVAAWPWPTIATVAAGAILTGVLVWAGLRWPVIGGGAGAGGLAALAADDAADRAIRLQPFVELSKLVAAALIGALVTAVHRPTSRDRLAARSMAQAQMLLCVSGALMMVIIGNSLARAFGIAGAAGIIRFRTPVDDPKDVTILFILMGLGMAAGLGAFAVAGLGTAFLCVTLLSLDAVARQHLRVMAAEITANGRTFPTREVEEVFARHQVVFEAREIMHGEDVTVKYHTWLDPRASLEELSAAVRDIPGVREVGWVPAKRA